MSLETRKRILKSAIERNLTELEYLEELPEDDFEEGAVLWFEKQFQSGGTKYTYCFVKANGAWYSSGPRGGGTPRRWEEVLDFIGYGNKDIQVWHATEWELAF